MEEINIRDFLNYLKKYVLVIVVVALVLIIGVFIYDKSIKKPLYTTYTTIILTKSNETQTGTTITQNDILLNQKLVETYSKIIKSKLVLEQVISEAGKEYGKNIIKEYSNKLTIEIGKKYNERNLRYMRKFYELFVNQNWNTMCSNLTWSHYREVLSLGNFNEIKYYLEECENKNLSVRELRKKLNLMNMKD